MTSRAIRRCRILVQVLLVILSVYGNALTMTTATAPNADKKIILWNSGTCPYAQRAWIALLEKQVEFEHRIVDLQNKPADFVAKYAEAIGATDVTSVRAKVPLLEYGDNDKLVVESEDVIKFIGETIGTNNDMYPKEQDDANNHRAHIEAFIQAFEKTIQGYYKFMTATNQDEVDQGKSDFCNAFINDLAPLLLMSFSSSSPFCCGEIFSVAECYAAPWIYRYQITIPYFRGLTMHQLLFQHETSKSGGEDSNSQDEKNCNIDKVLTWMDAVCNRPSVQATNPPNDYILKSTKGFFIKYVTPNSPAAAAAAEAAVMPE